VLNLNVKSVDILGEINMGHKAIVAKITEVFPINGADKIHVAKVLGESVVVSKEWGVGFEGILFPVDVQLSEDFAHHNNLYRHSNLNKDQNVKGFFEDNRRVRAQPFLKVKSEGFFADKSCLDYLGSNDLKLGDTFDELNGKKVCEKYYSEQTRANKNNTRQKKVKKNTTPFFEKHVDSEQLKHYAEHIPVGSLLSFHAKVHGTSARMAYTQVAIDLPKWKQIVNKLLPVFAETKWDYVVGTRNVVISDGQKEGFHGSEQFRFDVMDEVKPYLEKGMTIFGEIAGYANQTSIMPKHSIEALKDKQFTKKYGKEVVYKYGCKDHEYRFHAYRITYLNQNGENVDFTQKQLEKWCDDRQILRTVDVHPQVVYDGDVEKLRELVYVLTERPDVLTEDYIDPSHVSEGIILRVDAGKMKPDFYKNKSYAFRVMEGLCQAEDPEDAS
jgi:hypothetical protein